jgi:hypothetical protein
MPVVCELRVLPRGTSPLFEVRNAGASKTNESLEREFHHCDTIYTTTDEDRLASFLIVGHQPLGPGDNGSIDSQYAGLLATRTDLRNGVFGAAVVRRWLRDLVAWQRRA